MMSSEASINLGFTNRWSPFRQLNQIVNDAILNKSPQFSFEFESSLQRYKSDLLSMLKNPPRNALHKEAVLNAAKDGIVVIQQQNRIKTVLPQVVVDESLLMSEMFDLNELFSLELIIAGENQESRYPRMTRGPIAVLLYYDGRKSLLNALQMLVQGRNGRTWSLKLNNEISRVINRFTDELKDEGLILNCIEQLSHFDINAEFDMLQRNRALGIPKYKKHIMNLLKDIRQYLADIVFHYAAQCDLNKNEVLKLIELISKKSEFDANGCLDSVSTTLVMALLYVLDVQILQTCEENDPRVSQLSLIKNRGLLTDINRQIILLEFSVPEVKTILQFCWSITAKTFASFPLNDYEFVDGESEKLIDTSLDRNVFEVFRKLMNETMLNEEFYMRRIHNIICDFIILMPLKIKELKDKGDEIGRIISAYIAEGIHPPDTLPRHFEKFLRFMAEFYLHDKYELSSEFWLSPIEEKEINNRQQLLCKFIRSLTDSYFPTVLHIPIIKLLTSLAHTFPFNIFNLIKSSGLHHQSSQFSIDHFIVSLNQYYSNIRGSDKGKNEIMSHIPISNMFIQSGFQSLNAIDARAICAFLELIEVIVRMDRSCCLTIAENQQYSFILSLIGMIRCAVTKDVKASILNCLSGFASSSSSVAFTIWSKMDSIVPKLSYANTSGGSLQNQLWKSGIAIEIEDIETKNEEYPLTIGFLKLIKCIFVHIGSVPSQQHHFSTESCLNFILNSIMFKANSRAFKFEDEKWTLILNSFQILYTLIENYEPLIDGPNLKSSFAILNQMLQENHLFRFIILTLEDIAENFESSIINIHHPSIRSKSFQLMHECAEIGLKLLSCICQKQNDYLTMLREIPGFPTAELTKLDVMFLSTNTRTGSTDRLTTLVRMMLLSNDVSNEALKLLNCLCKNNSDVPMQILMQLRASNNKHITDDFLINLFVECLESSHKELRISALNLILTCLDFSFGSSSYNIAHDILGFDKKLSIKEPGHMGQAYACFHSILGYFDNSVDLTDYLEERRLSMKIMHKLCTSSSTSENVLRFIRTSYDFIIQYLQIWEKKYLESSHIFSADVILPEFTSFLEILILEIKVTAQQNLKSYCASYINFLLSDSTKKRLLLFFSNDLFEHLHPPMPNLEYCQLNEFWKSLSEFSTVGSSSIDLKALHQRLVNDMKFSAPQLGIVETKVVHDEIKAILKYAASINESREKLEIKLSYFESWRELTETIVCVGALNNFSEELRSRILLEINHEMINRLSLQSTTVFLLIPMSSVILIISSSLYEQKNVSSANILACIRSIMNLLDSSAMIWNQQKRTRVYLYGALLYLIRSLPYGLGDELRLNSRLVEKLCKDILSGHEITKVLATHLLNESDLSWISDISSNGTLKLLMDNLLSDDRDIRANKCEMSKVFYAFDAKMLLFLRICTSSNGIQLLLHFDIIGTLSSLQCFDMYPFLIGKNVVCHKIFVNIIRLLLVISTTSVHQHIEEIGQFVASRSSVFNDVIRVAPTLNSAEGNEVLLMVTKLLSRYISYTNVSLQRHLISLLSQFSEITHSNIEIISNLLYGCLQMSRLNGLNPLFAPTLMTHYSDVSFGQQPLGLLVSLLNNVCNKWSNSKLYVSTIEYGLYLLWYHLNLYFVIMTVPNEEVNNVETMKSQSYELSELFNKIENIVQNNIFSGALIRRLRRIIGLKKQK